MAAKAGKKGKKKGTTMALTDFLSDEAGNVQGPGQSYVLANKSVDWAAEMDELDSADAEPSYGMPAIDRAKLPTAPKASRGPEDLARVPKDRPFKAFIGNLPYEATEEKIKDEFFRKLPVIEVTLPKENGRLRGFGYVEFETREALIEALSMSEEMLGGRKVRIDLAGDSQGDNRKGGGGRRDDGQPDRTEGDWRRSEMGQGSNDKGPSRYDDRGPSRYDERTQDRGSGRYSDRGSSNFDDRGSSSFGDRRDNRGYGDRGSGRYEGGQGRYDDRGHDDRRDGERGGFGRRDDRGGYGRDRHDDRNDRYGGGGGGRDRYDDRRSQHDDKDGGRRQFGAGFRRDDQGQEKSWERGGGGGHGGDRDRGYGGDRHTRQERHEEREPETPKERPRLHLQPRTKPVENTPEPKPAEVEKPKASIFGSAKPVDTAQREREIEERLMKQKLEPAAPKSTLESRGYGRSQGYDEPRDKYEHDNKENKTMSSSRRRSGSERSEEGDGRRERRSSGSSRPKKGSQSSQGRSRQDSGEQSSHPEVFSGGEEDKSHNAVSPSSPAYREEPVKLVPAPLPKENVWEKRKSSQTTQSPPEKVQEKPPPAQESRRNDSQSVPQSKSPATRGQEKSDKDQSARSNRTSSQSSNDSTPSKPEGKKEFVPAEPPKENPWMKRKQEMEQQGVTGKREPGPAPVNAAPSNVPNAWANRGGGGDGGDRGRGRGGRGGFGRGRGETPQKKTEKREKPLPQSIDEMPKFEEKKNKDFSDSNKFAGLLDEDGGDFDDDDGSQ